MAASRTLVALLAGTGLAAAAWFANPVAASSPPPDEAAARAVLAKAPFSAAALAELARSSSDPKSQQAFWQLADRSGWRNSEVREELFERHLAQRDYAAALTDMEALLRLNRGRDTVLQALGAAVRRDPALRAPLVAKLSDPAGWSARILARAGSALDDETLGTIIARRNAAGLALDPDQNRRLVNGLVTAGRFPMAGRLACANPALACGARLPAWQESIGQPYLAGFAWKLGKSYRVAGEALVASPGARRQAPASILLALPAGTYRLTAAALPPGWRWGLACGTKVPNTAAEFGPAARFTVGAGCPVQVLAIAAGSAPPPAPLGRVRLEASE